MKSDALRPSKNPQNQITTKDDVKQYIVVNQIRPIQLG